MYSISEKKIRKYVESRGYKVETINYSGRSMDCGGWDVWIQDKNGHYVDTVTGYSVAETIRNIELVLNVKERAHGTPATLER